MPRFLNNTYNNEKWTKNLHNTEDWHLPRERENLLGKFPEQGFVGGVGEHQYNVDVSRPQLDKVTDVGDVRQLRDLYKVLLRRTTAWTQDRWMLRGRTVGITYLWIEGFVP